MRPQTGRYGLDHAACIAQLLIRTDLTKIEQFDRVMAHAEALNNEYTQLAATMLRENNALRADRDAIEHQLNHIITGE